MKLALIGLRRPVSIHDFDDELAMIKCAEALWPSEENTRIRKVIEAERAQWAAAEGQP
jgi:hypothetical protein